jgi:hypothetical protein
MSIRGPGLLVLVTILTLACGPSPDSTTWEVRRDSVGDTTTVRTLSGQVWSSEVRVVGDLTIGVLDGPEHLIFGEITRMAMDAQGGIYVLDAQVPEVRHFSSSGNFLGVVGRSGEGPGEYTHFALVFRSPPNGGVEGFLLRE